MAELEKRLPSMDPGVLGGLRTATLGFTVGVLATCFNVPFDVVKSRFQSQLPGGGGGGGGGRGGRKYTRVLSSLVLIYR